MKNESQNWMIDLKKLYYLLKSKAILIISAVLVCALLSFSVAILFITPSYSARAELIVNNAQNVVNGTVTNSDVSASTGLANTYSRIIKSHSVLERVIRELALDYSYEAFREKIDVQAIEDTQIVSITVKDGNPETALLIAQKIAEIAPQIIMEKVAVGSVVLIDDAWVASKPTSPNKRFYFALGALIGLVGSVLLVIISDALDDTFDSANSVKRELELPVLGIIPIELSGNKDNKGKRKEIVRNHHSIIDSPSFEYIEAYKSLRANLDFVIGSEQSAAKVLLITSSDPAEGKTNVSLNLATSLAENGKRVIVVDCDLRKGTIHRYLKISRYKAGLVSVLDGMCTLDEAICAKPELGFDVLTCGITPNNPSELLSKQSFASLMRELAERYDFVICDAAPINSVADTTVLCRFVDAIILVVSYNRVPRESVIQAKEQIDRCNVPILGIVFNLFDSRDARKKGGSSYYYYSYYGEYGKPGAGNSSGKRSGTGGKRKKQE